MSNRRKFLTRAAVGGGLVWAAPTVLSSSASAGPGTPLCGSCGQIIAGGTGNPADLASWTLTGSTAVSSGGAFRAGGGVLSTSTMTQIINLTGTCDDVPVVLSASLRGTAIFNIATTVVATWFAGTNGTGANLGTMNISSSSATFTTFTDTDVVPDGAQSVRVVINMTRSTSLANSGGSDNITLTLC
jgi:hypothetical protein